MSVYSVLDDLDEEAATSYVEKSGDLKVEIADRLALVVTLLIEGRLRVDDADVVWPQWWAVISGFTQGYELDGLLALREGIVGLQDESEELTASDQLFLWTLRAGLQSYLAHRDSGDPVRFASTIREREVGSEAPTPAQPWECTRPGAPKRRHR